MRFQLLTIFPSFFDGPFEHGVVGRAAKNGLIEIETHDLRRHATDRHRSVDDRPFGGGEGMVIMVEPVCLLLEELAAQAPEAKRRRILLSAQGKVFDQEDARRWAEYDELTLVCGRYEGVDERVADHLVDEEVSVGSFVLSGGEWAAGMIVDSVARLVPGVLGNEASSRRESFAPSEDGGSVAGLDCPHYTRPAEFRGWATPEVLLSGDHEKIRRWREEAAREKTRRYRPDLLDSAGRDAADKEL